MGPPHVSLAIHRPRRTFLPVLTAGARQWAPIIVACVLGLFLLLVIPLAIFVIRRSLRQHAARVDAARAGADPGDLEK